MQTQAGRSMSWGRGEEREWIRVHTVGPLDATTGRRMWPCDAEQEKAKSSWRTRAGVRS